MRAEFSNISGQELLEIEGGNPVLVYYLLAAGKYVVVPALVSGGKIIVEAAIGGIVMKAGWDFYEYVTQ